jgi:hypothetical protein
MADRREHAIVLAALIVRTSAPVARHIASIRATVSGAFSGSGHSTTLRPTYRSGNAASTPLDSRPAIGWAGTNCAMRAPSAARGRDDIGLGAARIGDDRRRVEPRRDAREQRARLRDRRGQQHEIGAGQRVAQLRVVVERRRAVDHAERERALDRRTRTAHADDLARPPGRARAARASDPPIRPTPKMTSLLNAKPDTT